MKGTKRKSRRRKKAMAEEEIASVGNNFTYSDQVELVEGVFVIAPTHNHNYYNIFL